MNRTVEFGEEMQEPQHSVIHIKWNQNGILRRFQLSEHEWKFSKLLEKIRMVEPLFCGALCYSDEDGDKIVFSSTTEMDEMLAHFRQLRVTTIKIESIDNPQKSNADHHSPAQAAKEAQKILHPNIICDLCDSPVRGIRYKCATCDDYDLCENCEKTGAHKEHAMIRLVTPDPTKLYELLYSLRRPHREHRGRHGWPRHGAPPFNNDCFVNKMRERTDRLQKLHESVVRNDATPQNPGVVHQNSVASGNTSTPKPNTTPTVLHRQPEMNQGFRSGSSQSNPQPNAGVHAQKPPIVDHFQQKMDYLKNIGSQVQQALLHFGIECETTVEDDHCRVHGRVPLVRAASQNQAQSQTSNSNQAPKRKSEDRTAAEESKLPKKTETSHIAAQTIADQTARESLSQAIQTATHQTINRASQASLEALNAATEIISSLGLGDQVGETTNRRGAEVLGTVKTGVESFANAMTPLIADLTEKCQIMGEAIPMPPPPMQHQFQAPQQNSTPQPNSQELITEGGQNSGNDYRNQVEEHSAMDTTEEIIHIDDDNESCHTAVELDSDVVILHEMVNMPDVEESRSQPAVEENNGTSGTPNNSNNTSGSSGNSEAGGDSYQMDSDEEWMLVSKSSYKQLCDFYEKQRKAKEGENTDDLEEIFGVPSGQQKEALQAALSRATSTSSRVIQESQPNQITNVIFEPEQVPASLVQASQAAATSLNHGSNSASKSAIYPELVEESKCCAGMPYYNPVKPHNKKCYMRHPDAKIQRAVEQLENMGYDNCNGWLTRLAEMHNGNIEKMLDSAIEDPLYLARLLD